MSSEIQNLNLNLQSYASADLESMQVNGKKVFNLAQDWHGPPPPNGCELFIKRIPRHLNEYFLLPHFQRFGKIYEFRLMMDFNEFNRGYGFVKYTIEEDAARALEVMNHFFIQPKRCIEVERSFDKCRLFVSNIPKDLCEAELEYEFRQMFPNVEKVITHRRISDKNQNRGFLFLDFPNHEEALFVKKQTTPGRLRKWGKDLKIVWANTERTINPDVIKNIKTLFVRNVDLTVKNNELYEILNHCVQRSEIVKISRVREFAFIDFSSRKAAEKILNQLNGYVLKGYTLGIEWALPTYTNANNLLRNNDFDAVLRLKCISNYWSVPVIVFGRAFVNEYLQYVAILIREKNTVRIFFMELDTKELTDIQSRACEVLVTLIEKSGELPAYNYVFKVNSQVAYIVGFIENLDSATFVKAFNISNDLFLYWNEIRDLSISISTLYAYEENQLISMYYTSILRDGILLKSIFARDRLFGSIHPLYRKKTPLKYSLNNTQIILCLIHISSYSNVIFPYEELSYNFIDTGNEARTSSIEFSSLNLLPLHFTQLQNSNEIIQFVKFLPNSKSFNLL